VTAIRRTPLNRRPGHDPAGREDIAPVLPKVGDVVAGKYRIEKVVGEGGMGIVYAAHHLVLDQRVALKLLLVDSVRGDETVERFVREAQAAARLRSEHVVRVTDAGALDSGVPFLAMEFLQGCDLAELVSLDGPLPAADVADYLLQVLSALAQAHAAGIVHRDLKPANLFLALREDGSNIIKVLDFGISKQRSERAQWKELTGKAVLGTPAYMSPEQLRSSKSVDARADIWSLGVVMYELLSGKLPFDGETPGEIFAAILERSPAPLRAHRPSLSQAWEDIVMRCLRRAPEERFADVGELARALAPFGSGRWAQVVPAIERAQAKSLRSIHKTDVALVAAAVSAAIKSLPPPMRAPAPADGGSNGVRRFVSPYATLGTGKTLVADLFPPQAQTTRRRPGLWSASASASASATAIGGVFLIAAVVLTSRALSPSPHHVVAALRPSGTAQAPLPPMAIPEPIVAVAGASASTPSSLERPGAVSPQGDQHLQSMPPKPPAVAPPNPVRVTPANRSAPPLSAKQIATEPRPKFLKSWR
jgi:eukaryotic-like serine/threonine-protein kinase